MDGHNGATTSEAFVALVGELYYLEPEQEDVLRNVVNREKIKEDMSERPRWHQIRETTGILSRKAPAKQKGAPKANWALETSIYAPRASYSDSKDFYDSAPHHLDNPRDVGTMMFELDWIRVTQKTTFQAYIKRALKGDMARIRVLKEQLACTFVMLVRAFDFYATTSTGDGFCLKLNGYSELLDDLNIPEASGPCATGGLDRIFIAVNSGTSKQNATDVNDIKSLMRYEYLEAMIRIAYAKFVQTEKCESIEDGLRRLCEEHILAALPDEAKEDQNDFRRRDLYQDSTEALLKAEKRWLFMVFKLYSCSNLMTIDEWLKMLNEFGLIDTTFTKREARFCFTRSKLHAIDELRGQKANASMHFVDFLEGLVRVADMKLWPTDADLEIYEVKTLKQFSALPLGSRTIWIEAKCAADAIKKPPITYDLKMLLRQMFEVLDKDGDGDVDQRDIKVAAREGMGI